MKQLIILITLFAMVMPSYGDESDIPPLAADSLVNDSSMAVIGNDTVPVDIVSEETLLECAGIIDQILQSRCLLYPLECKYNEDLLANSIGAVNIYSSSNLKKSKDFNSLKNTYLPLLNKYSEYNQEMVEFLKKLLEDDRLSLTNNLIKAQSGRYVKKIETLSYYHDCYIYKDKPPYKSITYLDNVINEYISIINNGQNVKKRIQGLIDKLL